jgi:hypothetical protein
VRSRRRRAEILWLIHHIWTDNCRSTIQGNWCGGLLLVAAPQQLNFCCFAEGGDQRDVLALFPLLRHQWPLVETFQGQILQRSQERLQEAGLAVTEYATALSGEGKGGRSWLDPAARMSIGGCLGLAQRRSACKLTWIRLGYSVVLFSQSIA